MASFENYQVILPLGVIGMNNFNNTFSLQYMALQTPQGFLDFHALGGPANDPSLDPNYINLRFTLDGQNLGIYSFHRWTDHGFIVPDRAMIMLPQTITRASRLVVESVGAPPGILDFFFFGPAIAVGELPFEG